MYIAHIAMNRMVEERAAEDDAFRRALEQQDRPLLSHGRGMSDDALLGKLRSLGFDAERKRLWDLFPSFVSAQAMAEAMMGEAEVDIPDLQEERDSRGHWRVFGPLCRFRRTRGVNVLLRFWLLLLFN